MSAKGVIVPIPYKLAEGVLYPYHMAQPISPFSDIALTTWASQAVIVLIPHGLAEVIYTPQPLPYISPAYFVIILGTLNMEHIIYVRDSFFNMNSIVMFILWLDYII